MSIPTYIYKIVPYTPPLPNPLPETLPVSELDSASGFIHLSTAKQIPGTLKRFFSDHQRVYLLRIKYSDVEPKIKWENGNGSAPGGIGEPDIFPHLYNGLRLGNGEIVDYEIFENSSSWDQAINEAAAKGWFVY